MQDWRRLESNAAESVKLASDLIPALRHAEEKAHLARITSDIAARYHP